MNYARTQSDLERTKKAIRDHKKRVTIYVGTMTDGDRGRKLTWQQPRHESAAVDITPPRKGKHSGNNREDRQP